MQSIITATNAVTPARSGRFTSRLVVVIWTITLIAQAGRSVYLIPVKRYGDPAGIGASLQMSDLVEAALFLLMVTFGALIVLRAAERRYGWLMLAIGFFVAMVDFTAEYSLYALLVAPQDNLPLGWLAAWVQDLWTIPTVLLVFLLPVLFPDGKLPSLRWRGIFWLVMAGWSLFILVFAFARRPLSNANLEIEAAPSNPLGFLPVSAELFNVSFVVLIAVSIVTGMASLVSRWRSAHAEVRQQIKWIVYAFLLMLVALAASYIETLLREMAGIDFGLGNAIRVAMNLSLLGMMAALGIAVLKYRLYDIDIIINRTLVYGTLTAAIVAAYVFFVAGLGALLPLEDNLFLSLVTTGVIAVLFNPLRVRLQRTANRLMFGERDDPYWVLSRLSRQLQETTIPGQTLSVITSSICQALKLPYASIQLLTNEGDRQTDAITGQSMTGVEEFPLLYQGETVGWLVVAPRLPGKAFNTRERRLLVDIAAQAGAAAYSVRLMKALQRSREKMVLAREEERRRIRRDLHDGLGPSLASQTFKLDAALELLQNDPQTASQLLTSLKAQNQSLVADIRRLVYELRPPTLDELGLAGALATYTRQINTPRITVMTNPDPLPALQAGVEVAAYRIAQEGITNVVRHAHARECKVTLEVENTWLVLTVSDDGVGPPPDMRTGMGLASMRERAEELGGSIDITAIQPKGTQVTAVFPTSPLDEQPELAAQEELPGVGDVMVDGLHGGK
jgi:signal transduction histidine kinase